VKDPKGRVIYDVPASRGLQRMILEPSKLSYADYLHGTFTDDDLDKWYQLCNLVPYVRLSKVKVSQNL
jgi:hypothetical protein